jgi:shikimate dehydrogenase
MPLTGKAKIAGVFGWPVSHSKSPLLHGHWLATYGIDGTYIPLATSPENFAAAVRALPKLGFSGANVTIPHKEAALKLADHVTERAARIGAVNTLIVQADGTILGDNTDGYGFMANLQQNAPSHWDPAAGSAVVLGAGGAARAILVALADAGVPKIILTNRTQDKAHALAALAPVEVVPWDAKDAALENANLLVNTTALGMQGKDKLLINIDKLPKSALVTDIVYTPLKTELLQAAAARGNPTVDGLGMLLHQAVPGFAAWFGIKPEVTEELRDAILAIPS